MGLVYLVSMPWTTQTLLVSAVDTAYIIPQGGAWSTNIPQLPLNKQKRTDLLGR